MTLTTATPPNRVAPPAAGPFPAIDAPPGRPGDALLRDSHVPVWHIISELEELDGDRAAVAVEFGIADRAIAAALQYYRDNGPAIEAAILDNRRPDNL